MVIKEFVAVYHHPHQVECEFVEREIISLLILLVEGNLLRSRSSRQGSQRNGICHRRYGSILFANLPQNRALADAG